MSCRYANEAHRKCTSRVIYGINSPENKNYVGYASVSYKRIRSHKHQAFAKKDGDWKDKSDWKKAIRDIGWENMTVTILEFVKKEVSLKERERFWIKKLKADVPEFGYNNNPGGGGREAGFTRPPEEVAKHFKPVISTKILERVDATHMKVIRLKHVSMKAASEELSTPTMKINRCSISLCCSGEQQSSKGYTFRYATEAEKHKTFDGKPEIVDLVIIANAKNAKPIVSIFPTGNGKAIKKWHVSSTKGARDLKILFKKNFTQSNIAKCLANERPFHQGHHFRKPTIDETDGFEDMEIDYDPEPFKISHKRKRE